MQTTYSAHGLPVNPTAGHPSRLPIAGDMRVGNAVAGAACRTGSGFEGGAKQPHASIRAADTDGCSCSEACCCQREGERARETTTSEVHILAFRACCVMEYAVSAASSQVLHQWDSQCSTHVIHSSSVQHPRFCCGDLNARCHCFTPEWQRRAKGVMGWVPVAAAPAVMPAAPPARRW